MSTLMTGFWLIVLAPFALLGRALSVVGLGFVAAVNRYWPEEADL